MEVRLKRLPLLEKISAVSGLTETNSPNEVIRNVLVRCSAKKNLCYIAATDLESTIVSHFKPDDSPSADFEFLIHGQKFLDIIRQMEEEEISLSIHKNNWIEINTPCGSFKFPCSPATDFPKIPVSGNPLFTIPAEVLSGFLSNIINFAENEALRRNINGVLFEKAGDNLRFVATDSHRLAYFQRKVEMSGEFEKVLITRRAVVEMSKALRAADDNDGDRNVVFSLNDSKVFFTIGGTTIVSTLIDTPFPEYTRVIPDVKSATSVRLDNGALLGAVKRVSVFSEDPKRVNLGFKESGLSLSSGKTQTGEGVENVPFTGSKLSQDAQVDVSFNPVFITDSLQFLDGEEIDFCPSAEGPSVIKLADTEDFLCVLMPVVS